ncbi:hypothetical protein PR048_021264 [Dryococelus australis]|uniref:Uncharacterized protein n=1 Tax=Dryococelus australis TaxID=614101 RepID=A0ABQ9GXT6_9NEOP|nr:hypothetical protein PR048_021264 [Dryococelus australis]
MDLWYAVRSSAVERVALRYTLQHGLSWSSADAGCCPEADGPKIVGRLLGRGRGAVVLEDLYHVWLRVIQLEYRIWNAGQKWEQMVGVVSHPHTAGPSMLHFRLLKASRNGSRAHEPQALACIVDRVDTKSLSAWCRSSRMLVDLARPEPVLRVWVPSRIHCSQQHGAVWSKDPHGGLYDDTTTLWFSARLWTALFAKKVVSTKFWDYTVMLLVDFLSRGATVNAVSYLSHAGAVAKGNSHKTTWMDISQQTPCCSKTPDHSQYGHVCELLRSFRWELLDHPQYTVLT